jgi:uncharacterized protein
MKLKRFFVHIMPDKEEIQEHAYLRLFSNILQDPNIFHLTRRSAAGGVASGLFLAFLPIPGHMILAAMGAVLFRVNLPLSILFTWVSNPFTVAPLYYLGYKIGAIMLGRPVQAMHFEMTWTWFGDRFLEIWPSLVSGSLLLSIVVSTLSYGLVRLLWRIAVLHKWKNRRNHGYAAKPE